MAEPVDISKHLALLAGIDRRGHYFWRTWHAMRQRCYNPANPNYHNYGGRGIEVYEHWRDDFEAFNADILTLIGPKPSSKHSLDRIDNDGDYEPGNVRWATAKQQAANRRPQRPWRKTLSYDPEMRAKIVEDRREIYNWRAREKRRTKKELEAWKRLCEE